MEERIKIIPLKEKIRTIKILPQNRLAIKTHPYLFVTDIKPSLQNLKDEIKEASEYIKVCDKLKQRGKEIILSEDLCSVKDVEIFLNKINKAFKKHIGELE